MLILGTLRAVLSFLRPSSTLHVYLPSTLISPRASTATRRLGNPMSSDTHLVYKVDLALGNLKPGCCETHAVLFALWESGDLHDIVVWVIASLQGVNSGIRRVLASKPVLRMLRIAYSSNILRVDARHLLLC